MFWVILIGTLIYFFANLAKSIWADPFWLIPIGFAIFAWIFPVPATFIFLAFIAAATVYGFRETWRGSAY